MNDTSGDSSALQDGSEYKVVVTKINDQDVRNIDSATVPFGGKVKVSVTAYYYDNLNGYWDTFLFRHMNFTFYRITDNGYMLVLLKTTALTNIVGKATVTYDYAMYQPAGKYMVQVVYAGDPDPDPLDGRKNFVISSSSSDEQSGGTDPNQSSDYDESNSGQTVPMQDTGAPISMLVVSILAVIGGLVHARK